MLKKVSVKLMRFIAIFNVSRSVGIYLKKLLPNKPLEIIRNSDINFDSNKIISELNTNGFSSLVSISDERLNKIIDYSNKSEFKELNGVNSFKINYESPKKPSKALWYTSYNLEKCQAVKEIIHDESVLKIVKSYIGAEPKMIQTIMWWSFPPEEKNYNSLYGFHYDIDALKFIKLFIYITDVDEQSGPHVIISKTHLKKSFFEKRNRRLKDDQVEKYFDKNQINVMTADKGHGFFEDTFAYHKGTTPQKPRLILQVEYSI